MEAGSSGCPTDGITGTMDLSEPMADITGRLHRLPCCIKHTGPCSVSHYFKPKQSGVVIDGAMVEEASFRGRQLEGATIPIPNGYCAGTLLDLFLSNPILLCNLTLGDTRIVQSDCDLSTRLIQGFVLEKKNSNENISGGDIKQWKAHSKFRNITYWNHDSLPSLDDEFIRLFHWFSVADALHKPLTADELDFPSSIR